MRNPMQQSRERWWCLRPGDTTCCGFGEKFVGLKDVLGSVVIRQVIYSLCIWSPGHGLTLCREVRGWTAWSLHLFPALILWL